VPEDGYTPQQYADDIAGLVTALGLPPVVAIGHSMGGATVTAFAARHPQLTRAIVPVDSAVGVDRSAIPAFEPLLAGLGSPAANDVALAFFQSAFYPPASPPFLAAWHGRRVMAMPQHVLRKAFGGMFEGEDAFGFRDTMPAYAQAIACPALVFRAGNQDPQAVAQWERSLYGHPYSKAVGWEGTGHFLHQERPSEFNAILGAWLDGLPA
jgi:pimeloyl-ACP methyl ester carboxylesterase